MNYQNILCIGDSQTLGARSYGCYPLYLAKILSERTPYQWRTIARCHHSYKARDLWFMLNEEIDGILDTYQACILIGTNDVGNDTPLEIFEEYYRQIIRALLIKGYKAILCGEIPPIHADGHVFFKKETVAKRDQYVSVIRKLVDEFREIKWVPMKALVRDCYTDPVHFNELGNQRVAESFCEVILSL